MRECPSCFHCRKNCRFKESNRQFLHLFAAVFVKCGVAGVVVFAVEAVGRDLERFAEPLIVIELSLPQKAQRIENIGVVVETDEVVIGRARLLLCCNHIRTTCD